MPGTILDHRSDRLKPNVDAVVEPFVLKDQGCASASFVGWNEMATSRGSFAVTWQHRFMVCDAVPQAK